jgi:lipopolysaccharide export system ATP-binding protein|tara:strand:- start:97405 stop:98145 length:741 start_codon:yes stop_codon:yes gene_type:complete
MRESQADLLQIESIKKSYGRRQIIKDVSLEVSSGQVIGLLGPNGAGKTTCFYMIAGLVAADGGRILLNGDNLAALSMQERARRGIGYLPQEASVFRKLSVRENILSVLQLRKELSKQERADQTQSLLEEFHITHIAESLGTELSGGERRRVEIARALAAEPSFILLDEPFAGVDPVSVGDIKKIIEHLCQRGIGVLITDHNVRETLSLCDCAYIVGEGVILASGTTEEIMQNSKVREVYLGDDFHL